jgi:hypothetical protein
LRHAGGHEITICWVHWMHMVVAAGGGVYQRSHAGYDVPRHDWVNICFAQ